MYNLQRSQYPGTMKNLSSPENFCFEKLILENVSDAIVVTRADFLIESWNEVSASLFEFNALPEHSQFLLDYPPFSEIRDQVSDCVQQLSGLETRQFELKVQTNGIEKIILFTFKSVCGAPDDVCRLLITGKDITALRRSEEKLISSEKFYRSLIADGLDVTLLLQPDGKIVFATPSVKHLLGYTPDELQERTAFEFIHPEDIAFAFESFNKEVHENPEVKFIIVRIKKKSGEWLPCMVRGHNLLDNPDVNAIAVYIHDDTPRKQATEALKQSEKQFRKLIRDLQVGVMLMDAEGNIMLANQAAYKVFEVTEDYLLGEKIWELFSNVCHEDERQFQTDERPAFIAMSKKELVKDVVMGMWNKERKERIWIIINAEPILDENGDLQNIVCSFTDITERKKFEKKKLAEKIRYQRQISQATIDGQEKERLEIGKELHDNLGQQLTTVKLFLDLAKSSESDQAMEMINLASKGVNDLINEVRAMSRSLVPPTLRDLGFVDAINDLLDSLRPAKKINIEFSYPEMEDDVLNDQLKLALYRIIQEQVNNILKHASADKVIITLDVKGEAITLSIKDDGVGFDTMSVKKGIGIMNIRNRVELLGGSVQINSAPGEGCEVLLMLPAGGVKAFEPSLK